MATGLPKPINGISGSRVSDRSGAPVTWSGDRGRSRGTLSSPPGPPIPTDLRELRPLGISTVRDRVCMTAAMLVLEPIFEADLPPEIYTYRAGRNAQQAVVKS